MKKLFLINVLLAALAIAQSVINPGGSGGVGGASGSYSAASQAYTLGTTYFLPPGGGAAPNSTEAAVQGRVTIAGTISKFSANVSAAPSSNTITFTWRKATPPGSSSDQTVTCAITGSATSCADLTHNLTIAVGDLIDVKVASTTGTVTAAVVLQWGTPGIAGPAGANGQSVTSSVEAPGVNCANGGTKLVSASGTTYTCNGPTLKQLCSGGTTVDCLPPTDSGGKIPIARTPLDTALWSDIGGTPASPATVTLNTGDNVPAVVAGGAAGTKYTFSPGSIGSPNVFLIGANISPHNGDTFTTTGAPGTVVLSGAITLTGASLSGGLYQYTGQTSAGASGGLCESGHTLCVYPQDLYFDNTPLVPVTSTGAVVTGTWYWDRTAHIIYIFDNPSGHTVELGVTSTAISSSSTGVTVSGLVVEKFAGPGGQSAAIYALGSGWTITGNEVRLNHSAGINAADGSLVSYNNVHNNGDKGIGGVGSGVKVFRNTVNNNNYAHFDPTWEAGGIKLSALTDAIIRGNYVHDNYGPGIWADQFSLRVLLENNRIESNIPGDGIKYEISSDCTIRKNTVIGNRWASPSLLFGSQIHIQNSQNCEVYDNWAEVIAPQGPGIGITQQDRSASMAPWGDPLARNNNIHDNIVIIRSGVSASNSGLYHDYDPGGNVESLNYFSGNHWHAPDLTTIVHFGWGSTAYTFPAWQTAGFDSVASGGYGDTVLPPAPTHDPITAVTPYPTNPAVPLADGSDRLGAITSRLNIAAGTLDYTKMDQYSEWNKPDHNVDWNEVANRPKIFTPVPHHQLHEYGSPDQMTVNNWQTVGTGALPYSSLGTCGTSNEGTIRTIYDAPSHLFGAVISTGGASERVVVHCNFNAWRVMGGLGIAWADISKTAGTDYYAPGGTIASADLPNPGASAGGKVQSKSCSAGSHVVSINTDSTVTCSADSGTGGGNMNTSTYDAAGVAGQILKDSGSNGLLKRTAVGITAAATAGTDYSAPGTSQTTSGDRTSTGKVDSSGATHTLPAKSGAAGSKPGTCTAGEQYFATDATAGQNLYFCTATNTWTQQLNSGGGTSFAYHAYTGTSVTTDFSTYTDVLMTASGNVTITATAPSVSGTPLTIGLCNDTTARTWTLPSTFKRVGTPSVASTCTYTPVTWDGTNYQGPGSDETPSILRFTAERADPGSGNCLLGGCQFVDSTAHAPRFRNSSDVLFGMVKAGQDVGNESGQVTATHLASPLSRSQGGTGEVMADAANFVFVGDSITCGLHSTSYPSSCSAPGLLATNGISASTTGTASSSSTALTVASGTGIAVGQGIYGAGIAPNTTVSAVSGTSVTLSVATVAALSSTALTFGAMDYPSQVMRMPAFSGHGTGYNYGVSGWTLSNIQSDYTTHIHPLSPAVTGTPGYLFVMIGTNDVGAGTAAATIDSALATYWSTARADGWQVVAFTITASARNGTQDQVWLAVNDYIRGAVGSWWNYVDAAAVLPDNFNPTYFYNLDFGHPINAGYLQIAQAASRVLASRSSTVGPFVIAPLGSGGYNSRYPRESCGVNAASALTGSNNSCSGYFSGYGLSGAAHDNTAIGATALIGTTTGVSNTGVGSGACATATTGSANTCIGQAADVSAAGATFRTAIGEGAIATADHTIVLGTSSDSAVIPGLTSAKVAGTNSSGQVVAATANDVSATNYVAGGGTAQAQTATYSPVVGSLTDGLRLCWKPSNANSATAPTFAPNGLTAHAVVKVPNATALAANDLITTQVACAIYNTTGTQWELQNPATAASGGGGCTLATGFPYVLGGSLAISAYQDTDTNNITPNSGTANTTIGAYFTPACNVTVDQLAFYVPTAGASGCKMEVGIYNAAGTSLLVHSGVVTDTTTSAACNSTGAKVLTSSTTPAMVGSGTVLSAGTTYLLAATSNETTVRVTAMSLNGNTGSLLNAVGNGLTGYSTTTTTSGALNTTFSVTLSRFAVPMFAVAK